jgi:hypothetical protein
VAAAAAVAGKPALLASADAIAAAAAPAACTALVLLGKCSHCGVGSSCVGLQGAAAAAAAAAASMVFEDKEEAQKQQLHICVVSAVL